MAQVSGVGEQTNWVTEKKNKSSRGRLVIQKPLGIQNVTDQWTDGWTYRQTNTARCRVACPRLKSKVEKWEPFHSFFDKTLYGIWPPYRRAFIHAMTATIHLALLIAPTLWFNLAISSSGHFPNKALFEYLTSGCFYSRARDSTTRFVSPSARLLVGLSVRHTLLFYYTLGHF